MPTINQLPSIDTLEAGDQVAVYDTSNGDARKASLTTLNTFIQGQSTGSKPEFVKQFSAPSATGFNTQVTDSSQNTWLILTPAGAYAAGTITLPSSTVVTDKQEVLVNCTRAVTTLTVAGNGSTVVGAPTTLAANAFFKLKYDSVLTTWYRVG